MKTRSLPRTTGVVAVIVAALAVGSCGKVVRQGRSPGYLIIDTLSSASGVKPDLFSNTLESDVITNVKVFVEGQQVLVPTIFEDLGRVRLRLGLKDVTSTGPTTNNEITVTQYRVTFRRADGRNTPGVDVPYAFDGAVTGTIDDQGSVLTFILVRAQAKIETPLKALVGMGGSIAIATIADVTFYGRDQAGNEVNVTGSISVHFADWGDPT
jgi:hypothetical protein